MVQIRLTKAGQIIAARGRRAGKKAAAYRKEVFRRYTLKNTGEKVLVNESEVFPEKNESMRRTA